MKSVFFFFVFVLCFSSRQVATAQPYGNVRISDFNYDIYENQCHNSAITSGNTLRLANVTYADYENDSFRIYSSSDLVYRSSRGWNHALKQWAFDSTVFPGYRCKNTYAPNGQVTQQDVQSGTYTTRHLHSYTTTGKVAIIADQEKLGGGWITVRVWKYQYDEYDALDRRTAVILEQVDSTVISYGPNGEIKRESFQLMPGPPALARTEHTSYVNGKVSEIVLKRIITPGSPLSDIGRHKYLYDPNGKVVTYYRIYLDASNKWDTVKISYNYNAQGLIATILQEQIKGGQSTNTNKIDITYNVLGQVATERYFNRDLSTGAWAIDYEKRYRYTPPFPLEIKSDVQGISLDVTVYPVPASNRLNILLSDGMTTGSYEFSIYNMQGILLWKWEKQLTPSSQPLQTDISELPAGNYLLQVSSNQGQVTKQFSVIR